MLIRLVGICLLFATGFWQVRVPGPGGESLATAATPGIVNFRGMPSTETTALGTKANGTCATDAYCFALVDPLLSGNGILVLYTYKAASGNTANIPAVADPTTYGSGTSQDTFVHCGTDGNNSTNDVYAGCSYVLPGNATTGAHLLTLTWTAAVTNVSVSAFQIYNVTAKDVYGTNSWTSTSTTFSAFSSGQSASASKDLWFEFGCATAATMPLNVGAWTVGSQSSQNITWTADLADRRDGCMIQHGVQTSTASLNPQFTNATAYNGVAVGVSFSAGSAGTAPSGMYIDHLYTVSSASGTGNLAYQVPLSGNLIVGVGVSGTQWATAVSDTTNGTWKACGPVNAVASQAANSFTYYYPNATAGLLTTTVTTSGTGDIGPMAFYSITGAATSQNCAHAAPQGITSATGANITVMSNYAPSSSAGIVLYGMSQFFNTTIGITAPSGGYFDSATVGGQSRDGPSLPDQNNLTAHFANTNNTPASLTATQTASGTAISNHVVEVAGFQDPSATLYPVQVNQSTQLSSASVGATNTLTLSYTPAYASSDILAAMACTTATSGTITVSDGTNGTWTNPVTAVNNNGVRCALFYVANTTTSAITITAHFSASTSFRNILLEECVNCTTIDKSNIAATTASGNILTGTSTGTLSNANEIAFGYAMCNNCNLTTNVGVSGTDTSPWTQNNFDASSGANCSGYLAVGATTAISVHFIDVGSATATDVTGIMTFHN